MAKELRRLGVQSDSLSDLLWPTSTRARKRKQRVKPESLQESSPLEDHNDDSMIEAISAPEAVTDVEDASGRRAKLNEALQRGERRLIVADTAATRGLHLDGVSTVIILGLAANADTYLHLAGRTGRWSGDGRAAAAGSAVTVTIATDRELQTLRGWSKTLGGLSFESYDE